MVTTESLAQEDMKKNKENIRQTDEQIYVGEMDNCKRERQALKNQVKRQASQQRYIKSHGLKNQVDQIDFL